MSVYYISILVQFYVSLSFLAKFYYFLYFSFSTVQRWIVSEKSERRLFSWLKDISLEELASPCESREFSINESDGLR